jgi:hypothetical protein
MTNDKGKGNDIKNCLQPMVAAIGKRKDRAPLPPLEKDFLSYTGY